mmetsp:Transcript_27918/g.90090  ORF Transcript_27918/g.90090 Transcript_27918/m.90090 type:complete len:257 (+) Transcript_27918:365-1135(+)
MQTWKHSPPLHLRLKAADPEGRASIRAACSPEQSRHLVHSPRGHDLAVHVRSPTTGTLARETASLCACGRPLACHAEHASMPVEKGMMTWTTTRMALQLHRHEPTSPHEMPPPSRPDQPRSETPRSPTRLREATPGHHPLPTQSSTQLMETLMEAECAPVLEDGRLTRPQSARCRSRRCQRPTRTTQQRPRSGAIPVCLGLPQTRSRIPDRECPHEMRPTMQTPQTRLMTRTQRRKAGTLPMRSAATTTHAMLRAR